VTDTRSPLLDAINKLTRALEKQAKDKQQAGSWRGGMAGRGIGGGLRRLWGGIRQRLGGKGGKGGGKVGGAVKLGLAGRAALAAGMGPVGVAALAIAALAALAKAAQASATALLESGKKYAEFSAQLGLVFSQRDLREAMRGMEIGNRTAGTARFAMEQEQRLKDETKELTVLEQHVKNIASGIMSQATSVLLAPLNKIAAGINQLIEKQDPDKNRPLNAGEFLDSVHNQAEAKRKRGDWWFDRPDFDAGRGR
jgi:hypothetical protein